MIAGHLRRIAEAVCEIPQDQILECLLLGNAIANKDVVAAGAMVSKNDGFCTKNEELCIKNEELCIKNEAFCIKNEALCIKNEALCIKNEASCIKNEELCIKTDELYRGLWLWHRR